MSVKNSMWDKIYVCPKCKVMWIREDLLKKHWEFCFMDNTVKIKERDNNI